MVDKKLVNYVENNILPQYNNFDKGHDINHIRAVINRSLEYCEDLKSTTPINENMVYTIAAFHDIGMKIERNNHAEHSANILLKDDFLNNFFNAEQMQIIADAVRCHSTSSKKQPTTIYAKIVSDADKDRDVDVGVMRGYNFSLKKFPNNTFEQHLDDVHREIVKRFAGEDIGGQNLVKFYISNEKNTKFMQQMLELAYDKEKLRQKLLQLLSKN